MAQIKKAHTEDLFAMRSSAQVALVQAVTMLNAIQEGHHFDSLDFTMRLKALRTCIDLATRFDSDECTYELELTSYVCPVCKATPGLPCREDGYALILDHPGRPCQPLREAR